MTRIDLQPFRNVTKTVTIFIKNSSSVKLKVWIKAAVSILEWVALFFIGAYQKCLAVVRKLLAIQAIKLNAGSLLHSIYAY